MKIYCSRYDTTQKRLDSLIGKAEWIRVNIDSPNWAKGCLYVRPVAKKDYNGYWFYDLNFIYVDPDTEIYYYRGRPPYDYLVGRTRYAELSDISIVQPLDIRPTDEILQIEPGTEALE